MAQLRRKSEFTYKLFPTYPQDPIFTYLSWQPVPRIRPFPFTSISVDHVGNSVGNGFLTQKEKAP